MEFLRRLVVIPDNLCGACPHLSKSTDTQQVNRKGSTENWGTDQAKGLPPRKQFRNATQQQ